MSAINSTNLNFTRELNQFKNQSLSSLGSLEVNGIQGANSANSADSFKDLLVQSIGHVNAMQQDANTAVETLMTGGDINAAEVLTAVQKADMSFRMMQQIRNKLMDAFQELKEIRI